MGTLFHKWVNVAIHLLVFAALRCRWLRSGVVVVVVHLSVFAALSLRWLRSVVVVVVVHLSAFAGFVMVRRCLAFRCAVHSLSLQCALRAAICIHPIQKLLRNCGVKQVWSNK